MPPFFSKPRGTHIGAPSQPGAIPPPPGSYNTFGRTLHDPYNNNTQRIPQQAYTCFMTSVGNGGNLRYDFSPDPSKIGWRLSANIQTVPSRGGQVSYATNRQIGPLEISGHLRSRWDLLELATFVEAHMKEAMYKGAALRLVYPERDIDFAIYIRDISEVGIDMSQAEIVPYTLNAEITGDHTDINIVELSELANIPLPADIGWLDIETGARLAKERFGEIVNVPGSGTDEEEGGDTPPEEKDVTEGDPRDLDPGSRPGEESSPPRGGPNLGTSPGL